MTVWIITSMHRFQSTLPRGERQTVANGCNTAMRFQSTLPRGERQFLRQMFRGHYHFNPRSHEGSDHISAPSISFHKISIHAPTRGATCSDCPMVIRQLFQSTLPRGERHGLLRSLPLLGYFNPRSHEGSDAHGRIYPVMTFKISIHAPTRGATSIFAKKFSFLSAKIV